VLTITAGCGDEDKDEEEARLSFGIVVELMF
jgi:hypothetical protein